MNNTVTKSRIQTIKALTQSTQGFSCNITLGQIKNYGQQSTQGVSGQSCADNLSRERPINLSESLNYLSRLLTQTSLHDLIQYRQTS